MVAMAFRKGSSAGYLSTGLARALALGSGTPVTTHIRTRSPLKMMMRSGSSCNGVKTLIDLQQVKPLGDVALQLQFLSMVAPAKTL